MIQNKIFMEKINDFDFITCRIDTKICMIDDFFE